jgi:hypothetical protein
MDISSFKTQSDSQGIININWENLSIEEIMNILDRLGVGFYQTLKLLLGKLKPGQKKQLMKLVQTYEIGKKNRLQNTRQAIHNLKFDPHTPKIVKHILVLLSWRDDKKEWSSQ